MLKLYFIVSLIYTILKTINAPETTVQGYIGFFLSRFFLSVYYILKDIVKIFVPKPEPKGRR